jgi:hypothetical protein
VSAFIQWGEEEEESGLIKMDIKNIVRLDQGI